MPQWFGLLLSSMKTSKLSIDEFEIGFASVASKNFENCNRNDIAKSVPLRNCANSVSLEQERITSPLPTVALIKELSSAVTRKICTGQVVISLAGACRELIDNSLDAGATNIEIRVKENGVDLIEVIDNGCGIEKSNFELLCKAHSTSKLFAISDFSSLSTFGFRGEALNALAALSELSITTRDSSSKVGTRLIFDKDGKISKQENCPRQVGTSFQRNSKREFMKMLNCVQSFALSRECRFSCSNFANGRLNQVLASPGSAALKETISNLFGSKVEKGDILEIDEALPSEEISALYGLKNSEEHVFHKIGIFGMISSCSFGHGRSTPDRQFIYVNKRPVDMPKLNRITNEVYSSFNRGRYSMLVLFITVDPASIDVNISPDKRTVFFQHEKELFAKYRACLLLTFSKVSGSCPMSNVAPSVDSNHALERKKFLPKTQLSDDEIMETDDIASVGSPILTPSSSIPESPTSSFQFDNHPFRSAISVFSSSRKRLRDTSHSHINPASRLTDGNQSKRRDDHNVKDDFNHCQFPADSGIKLLVSKDSGLKTLDDFSFYPIPAKNPSIAFSPSKKSSHPDQVVEATNDQVVMRPQQSLVVNMNLLRSFLRKKRCARMSVKKLPDALDVQKSNDMTDENQSEEVAEQHLSIMLDKDAFATMEVVGQFNNSFIITRLRDEMFMIDQHASDEKCNFERLQRTSRITTQKLIHPQMLQLGAVQESVLFDNLDVLRGNGFDFTFDNQEPIGNRISLASVPVVQGCDFNSDDIDEILAFLMEFPDVFTGQKSYAIFLLQKLAGAQSCSAMGTMDSPWNCPHGRPTIRHLCSMNIEGNFN
uniref:Uncharacterized protein n=1 Tax=Ditylenchus dipsaci TaxID=166011 RepID=A0A915DRA2_9BILA